MPENYFRPRGPEKNTDVEVYQTQLEQAVKNYIADNNPTQFGEREIGDILEKHFETGVELSPVGKTNLRRLVKELLTMSGIQYK